MENLKIHYRITLNNNDTTKLLDPTSFTSNELYHNIVILDSTDTYTVWEDTDLYISEYSAVIIITNKVVECYINNVQIHDLYGGFPHIISSMFAGTNVEVIRVVAVEPDTRVEVYVI